MKMMLGMFGFGGGEMLVVLIAVLILFGAKKIPELAKGLGQGIKEFKKATREVSDEINHAMDDQPPPPAPRKLPSTTVVTTEAEHSVPQSTPSPKV